MSLICSLIVTYYVGTVAFMSKEQLEGKLLKEDNYNYLVDFSKDAKKHKFVGDYSKKLINKQECIKN